MPRARLPALSLLCALLLGAPAAAQHTQPPPPGPGSSPFRPPQPIPPVGRATAGPEVELPRSPEPYVAPSLSALEKVDDHLYNSRWSKAKEGADKLIRKILLGKAGDPRGAQLATALTYRALAEAAEQSRADAVWDWQVAQALYAPVGGHDFSFYPTDTRLFAEHRRRERGETVAGAVDPEATPVAGPRPVDGRYPEVEDPAELAMAIEVIVGRDGSITHPVLAPPASDPVVSYLALEQVRRLRFEPATLDGEPVAVLHRIRFGTDDLPTAP